MTHPTKVTSNATREFEHAPDFRRLSLGADLDKRVGNPPHNEANLSAPFRTVARVTRTVYARLCALNGLRSVCAAPRPGIYAGVEETLPRTASAVMRPW